LYFLCMITDDLLPKSTFKWIDVQEPLPEDFERLNDQFNLPYLLVQDCLRPEHLPKFEDTEEGFFLMLRGFDSGAAHDAITVQDLTRKVALFITDDRLITIHRVPSDYLNSTAARLQKQTNIDSLQMLVHQVILSVIRSFELPLERLEALYDAFEFEILSEKKHYLSFDRIYHFRRQVFIHKRLLKQSNDALYRFKDFWSEHPSMLQDLRENIDQLYFQMEEFSESFERLLELHIMLSDQRANQVMKILTVFSAILLPLNFIASFYGMNFVHLPGLQSGHAFSLVVTGMLLVTFIMVFFFRSRGWFKFGEERD
jgi:magnesium transporter